MSNVPNRSIPLCIVLSIVTCGIYAIYWMYCLNEDSLIATNQQGTSGGMVILLSIVTCGIYGIYWMYRLGERAEALRAQMGKPYGSLPIIYLVLSILGLSIVSYALAQSELNSWSGGFAS